MIKIEIFSSAKNKWRLGIRSVSSFEQADDIFKFSLMALPFKNIERIEGPDILIYKVSCRDIDVTMTHDAPNITDIDFEGKVAESMARSLARELAQKYDIPIEDRSQEKHRQGVNQEQEASFLTRLLRRR